MTLTETPLTDAGDAAAAPARWTAQWKELYARGHHDRPVHGLRRVRRHVPPRRHRLRARGGQVHPLPPRGGARPGRLHPRRRRGCTTCTRACPRFRAWEPAADMHLFGRVREPDEMAGIWRQLLLTRAADDDPAREGPGRRVRLGDARVADGARLHRRGDGVGRRGRRRLEGQAGARPQHRGGPRHGRQPLHVLRQPAGPARRPRRRASTAWPSSAWAARPARRRSCGTARPARSPSRSCSTSGCCARRRSTTPSSPSSSRPSTACRSRTW